MPIKDPPLDVGGAYAERGPHFGNIATQRLRNQFFINFITVLPIFTKYTPADK